MTGSDLRDLHWDAFYEFYLDTGSRKWGRPYLNRRFFGLIGEHLADRTLLVMCRREGRYIAGALNFIGGDTLYGRNWGCIEDHPMLHFEACYYQAIEFAIRARTSLRRGRCPGAAQDCAGVSSAAYPQRALDCARRAAGRGRALPRA